MDLFSSTLIQQILIQQLIGKLNEPRRKKTGFFAYAKTKTQISFAVTTKLISAFVFAPRIVQSLYFLNPKFQASSHFLWLYSQICVGPSRKPRRPVFSQRGSIMTSLNPFFHKVKQVHVYRIYIIVSAP